MKYQNIFFDWDGTAVLSRKAPAEEVCKKMEKLLNLGVNLIVISGTTYENIAGGRLHEILKNANLERLYLGLGRGAHNYGFTDGKPVLLEDRTPGAEEKSKIDEVAFEIHKYLYLAYGMNTDIVFSRPNYCKVDIMVDHDRGESLFLTGNEIEKVHALLEHYRIPGGLQGVLKLCDEIGRKQGMETVTTTDAKYLEIGLTTKSNNVNFIVQKLMEKEALSMKETCFWGDEFTYLDEGVPGSDSFMLTEMTKNAAFFDVSENGKHLPEKVVHMGGGVPRFLQFLEEQIAER